MDSSFFGDKGEIMTYLANRLGVLNLASPRESVRVLLSMTYSSLNLRLCRMLLAYSGPLRKAARLRELDLYRDSDLGV